MCQSESRFTGSGLGYFCSIHNIVDARKFLFFGARDGVVTLMEFSDSTYSALNPPVYSVTITGSEVEAVVESNSYFIGVRYGQMPALLKFTADGTTATS